MSGYRAALLDWCACARRGRREPAALAARAAAVADGGLGARVAALGAAGHVLDFDDTYAPGLAHLSAPVAPAALVVGAQRGATVGAVVTAYAAGFEAMGALTRAAHPALYDGGWHPTAVCGGLGAAVATARLLDLDADATRTAAALALLRAAGLRSAFGSDGKALQVGRAAAAGVAAAQLAAAGARVDADRVATGTDGWPAAFGAPAAAAVLKVGDPTGAPAGAGASPAVAGRAPAPAIAANWIKAHPCCLQTHSAIECALAARDAGVPADAALTVAVHPVSRRAAAYDAIADGLQAKFSIPYLTAFTLRHGAPGVDDFDAVEPVAAAGVDAIAVREDPALGESEAVLLLDDAELARVPAAVGSPQNPMDAPALAAKVRGLGGDPAWLDDLDRPAAELLAALER